jgi:hypothetical protein
MNGRRHQIYRTKWKKSLRVHFRDMRTLRRLKSWVKMKYSWKHTKSGLITQVRCCKKDYAPPYWYEHDDYTGERKRMRFSIGR